MRATAGLREGAARRGFHRNQDEAARARQHSPGPQLRRQAVFQGCKERLQA